MKANVWNEIIEFTVERVSIEYEYFYTYYKKIYTTCGKTLKYYGWTLPSSVPIIIGAKYMAEVPPWNHIHQLELIAN